MQIRAMQTNHMTNPLGFTLDSLTLSWKTESETADCQVAARVEIALEDTFQTIVLDTGKSETLDSIACSIVLETKPMTRYFWRVTVWADTGETATSSAEWFETGKMDEPFAADFITPAFSDVPGILRKEFTVFDKPITSARLYAGAAGLYEVEINGQKAGDEYLAPFCNQYHAWMQYQTIDVTALLKPGANAIGVLLGDGWYKGRFGFEGGMDNIYGDRTGFIGELVIRFADGSEQTILSDTTWLSAPNFVTYSAIYDGETQDANKLIPGWSTTGLATDSWQRTEILPIDKSLLKARLSLPVIVKETRKPVELIHTPAGETVLDLGQNMVGWVSFEANLPKGTEIKLEYGEILQHGNFYSDNLRTAKQTFRYTADGTKRTVRPFFTYFGFRFVKVSGWVGAMDKALFTGCVVYSDMERIGHLETSNEKVNQLISNSVWGQKGNFLDVPTDCPQRDERMGWTGDAQVFCATAAFFMDTYAFYRKYLYDMQCEQKRTGGPVPVVVPDLVPGVGFDQSSAWADATCIIPWTSYLMSGDASILKDHYPSMKAYIASIKQEEEGRLWCPKFSFGDWLSQDGPSPYAPIGGTDIILISTAYYCYSTTLTAKAAEVLGFAEEAATYNKLAEEIRAAYQAEFVTPRGRIAVDTQTGAVVTLFMDLMSEEDRPRVAARLNALLKQNNYYLKTGFVGTPYLCRVLSENGYNDAAYKLLLNEKFPSWLYCVNLGATTIWERWNSVMENGLIEDTGMNSLNHYAYGSICEWLYKNVCGMKPVAEAPGFRKVRIAPQPNSRLQYAKCSYDSPVGVYESGWEIRGDGQLQVTVTVPFGGTAELLLPDSDKETMVLKRGVHTFIYQPTKEYRFRYSTYNTTTGEMMACPEVVAVVESVHPGAFDFTGSVMGTNMLSSTFRELFGGFGFPLKAEELDEIDRILLDLHFGR